MPANSSLEAKRLNSKQFMPAWRRFQRLLLGGVFISSGWMAAPGLAADRLMIRVGPLTQTIEIEDLEQYAETGVAPPRLKMYEPLLTPQVRQALHNHLAIDPEVSDRVINDILQSPNGEQLLDTLTRIAPEMTVEQIQTAIRLAASQTEGLSLLSILRSIPEDTLEIDLTAAIALASQLNLSRLESQALGSVLEHELSVEAEGEFEAAFSPSEPGPEIVRKQEMIFRDRKRDRDIPVDIYWSKRTNGPLVLFSHGFGADRRFLTYLSRHLASYGLTVASIEHPGSNLASLSELSLDPRASRQPSRILPATEFLDRPKDVSFVLDSLAKLNSHSYPLRGKFKTNRAVLIGHSLGGYTGLALAGAKLDIRNLEDFCNDILPVGLSPADWLQCAAVDLPDQIVDLRDPRIVQVAAMNPIIGELFGDAGLSQINIPTLMLASTHDAVTPTIDQQLRPFTQLMLPKYLIAVIGGTHLSVGDPANLNPALDEIPFMPELRGEVTANLRQFLQGVILSFVKQQTSEAATYAPFLTATYAQSFSTPDLPLRFSTDLPGSITSWLRLVESWSNQHSTPLKLMTSLLHLEVIVVRRRLNVMQNQMLAYLRMSYPSLIVVNPMNLFRQNGHLVSHRSGHPAK
ncbi:MAG: alpha/beta hydrolase [Leptolyngbyaceae cyanobacterium MO_188.B28]|nr:alpha/beta hydrolase [Leptolyngbyaceae cyanobacterium MO_188.B28]